MFNFEVGIIAEHRVGPNYEVFCNRCGVSIGVLAYRTIRDAVWATLGRGGVLCKDCRKTTCDVCGLEQPEDCLQWAQGPKNKVRLCMGCLDRIEDELRSCIFGQKS